MADFLQGFQFGVAETKQISLTPCASVEDLQLRLRALVDKKTSPTRAEHIQIALDISPAARLGFSLCPAADDEGPVTRPTTALPALTADACSLSHGPDPVSTESTFRLFEIKDIVTNQSPEDPKLSRLLAQHIMDSISAADSSTWSAQDTKYSSEGWIFTYICHRSVKSWNRDMKGKVKVTIGDYTNREPDPVLINRPAFDCRGSVRILFSRSTRSVSVQYSHTPLHKTVGEVYDYFTPPLRTKEVLPEKQSTKRKSASARTKRSSAKAISKRENAGSRRKKVAATGQVRASTQPTEALTACLPTAPSTHASTARYSLDRSTTSSVASPIASEQAGSGCSHHADPSVDAIPPLRRSTRRRKPVDKMQSAAGLDADPRPAKRLKEASSNLLGDLAELAANCDIEELRAVRRKGWRLEQPKPAELTPATDSLVTNASQVPPTTIRDHHNQETLPAGESWLKGDNALPFVDEYATSYSQLRIDDAISVDPGALPLAETDQPQTPHTTWPPDQTWSQFNPLPVLSSSIASDIASTPRPKSPRKYVGCAAAMVRSPYSSPCHGEMYPPLLDLDSGAHEDLPILPPERPRFSPATDWGVEAGFVCGLKTQPLMWPGAAREGAEGLPASFSSPPMQPGAYQGYEVYGYPEQASTVSESTSNHSAGMPADQPGYDIGSGPDGIWKASRVGFGSSWKMPWDFFGRDSSPTPATRGRQEGD